VILLHATQKIVAMEFAKATDNDQVWLFDNLSSCIFNKKELSFKYFDHTMEFLYVNFALHSFIV